MAPVRFLPTGDERARRTVLAVAEEPSVSGLILRYRFEQAEYGLPGQEGAFMICSFWLVSALVEIGEVDRANRLCEKLLTLASPLGLYAEAVDLDTGRHLGNFPQALTHLACISALMQGHAPQRMSYAPAGELGAGQDSGAMSNRVLRSGGSDAGE